jgi:hypothetical protein
VDGSIPSEIFAKLSRVDAGAKVHCTLSILKVVTNVFSLNTGKEKGGQEKREKEEVTTGVIYNLPPK